MNLTRIKTIYFKELVDLLRDRRTVIATIIVPVVLYPMLMLFSVQAASVQTGKVAEEQIVVGVESRKDQNTLMRLLANEPIPKDDKEWPRNLGELAQEIEQVGRVPIWDKERVREGIRQMPLRRETRRREDETKKNLEAEQERRRVARERRDEE